MIKPALVAFACMIALGACTEGLSTNSNNGPYAPGVDLRKEAVDGTVVGNRLLDAKQYELALEAYTRAAAQQGMSGEIYAGIGAANFGLGRLGQAEKQLRKAIEFEDAAPETWNNLGLVLMDTGNLPEAIEILRRAFALSNGENDEIRDNLRLALAMQGKTVYDPELEQELDLVRSGQSLYRLKQLEP